MVEGRGGNMNLWWVFFAALSCMWVLSLVGIRSGGQVGGLFFAALGCLWLVICICAEPLYDFGTYLLRKLGLRKVVELRERMKGRLLPPARMALLVMAVSSFVFAFL